MFFYASKVLWLLVQPLTLILLLSLAGIVSIWRRRYRTALACHGLVALMIFFAGYTSLGYLIIQPLEARFTVPDAEPERVGAIVLLGGATLSGPSAARQVTEMNEAGDRLTTTLWLAGRYPEAFIVLSGGSGLLVPGQESEAETTKRFLLAFGVAEERLVVEGQSRNTAENAAEVRDLLAGVDGEIVLVTSSFHMPRSVGLFAAQGIGVVPMPTDYRSSGREGFVLNIDNPNRNLETTTVAVREWIGLVAYYLTGKIEDVFPAPENRDASMQ